MSEKTQEMNWMILLFKLDNLNRKVKEPGWEYADKQEVYRIKDEILKYILTSLPKELSVQSFLIPYYAYSQETKDKAGSLMRRDPDRKPFEFYLGQVPLGPRDIEIPEKATVEVVITCAGQEYSFHQPLDWYNSNIGNAFDLEKKAWISAVNFHHMYLTKTSSEIDSLRKELDI